MPHKGARSQWYFLISCKVSSKTLDVNPNRSLMTALQKRAPAEKSDKTVNDLIWLLLGTWTSLRSSQGASTA